MIWTKVAIDDMASFDAYLDPSSRWNGFARPFFRKDDVATIESWLMSIDPTERLEYDNELDRFMHFSGGEYCESFYGEDIDGMHLYPIGAGSWVWLEDEED